VRAARPVAKLPKREAICRSHSNRSEGLERERCRARGQNRRPRTAERLRRARSRATAARPSTARARRARLTRCQAEPGVKWEVERLDEQPTPGTIGDRHQPRPGRPGVSARTGRRVAFFPLAAGEHAISAISGPAASPPRAARHSRLLRVGGTPDSARARTPASRCSNRKEARPPGQRTTPSTMRGKPGTGRIEAAMTACSKLQRSRASGDAPRRRPAGRRAGTRHAPRRRPARAAPAGTSPSSRPRR
jgi:hypothetical protein